jgi:hypothetical protein
MMMFLDDSLAGFPALLGEAVAAKDSGLAAGGQGGALPSFSPCVLGRGADVDGSCFPRVDTALILLASTDTDVHV